MKRLALINKDRDNIQYNNGDLVDIISFLTSQLQMASRKVSIKYVGPLAIYKIVDPHNYLLIRTNQGNVTNLSKLKQVMSSGLLVP